MVRPGYTERLLGCVLGNSSRRRSRPNNGGERSVGYTGRATVDVRQTFLLETAVAGARDILTPVGRFGGRAATRAAVALYLPRG